MKSKPLLLAVAALALAALPASAWWPKGHSIIGEAAVRTQPAEVPAFFRAGGGTVAHLSQDPDVAKARETPNLMDAENPEHFMDYELLQRRPLPPTRSQFLKLCANAKIDPTKVGYVPYAIAEWTERLSVAFAEHRKWPRNRDIQIKCLVYAGFLSHYAADMCQPLHVTVDYNGRARPDGSSPKSGIHEGVDSLVEKLGLTPAELARGQRVEPVSALMPAILRELEGSRALIARTYELEPQMPPREGAWTPQPEIAAFARERARESTRFLASLYLSAWRKSAEIKLPPWLEREDGAARAASVPAKAQSTRR
jgi:hypothetical protein